MHGHVVLLLVVILLAQLQVTIQIVPINRIWAGLQKDVGWLGLSLKSYTNKSAIDTNARHCSNELLFGSGADGSRTVLLKSSVRHNRAREVDEGGLYVSKTWLLRFLVDTSSYNAVDELKQKQ